MPLQLSAIEDPNFDREAEAYQQLHRRPHPLLPLSNLRRAALKEGFGWEVDELRGVVGLTATIDGTPHGAEVDLRALVDSDLDPDGSRITVQVIGSLKRRVAEATGSPSTDALHVAAAQLLKRAPRHERQPTYDEWCSLLDEMRHALGVERVRFDHDIAALQRQTAPSATAPLCLVAERGDERICVRWHDGQLVAHAA